MPNTLECPFLDSNPKFALGVEFGMLYVTMLFSSEPRISGCFHRDNQEQILLAANRLGWSVKRIKPLDETWFKCWMERREL